MAEYIYFCTSLPYLHYGTPPPLSSEQFLQSAETLLCPRDYARLSALDFCRAEQRVASSSFFCSYYAWEIALRNQVMAGRLKGFSARGESSRPRRGGSGSIGLSAAVEQVLGQPNPLAVERGLDRLRWAKLEEICGARLFGLDFLASYLLRLQLLERAALWERGAGEQQYERACGEIAGAGPNPDSVSL